MITGSSTDHLRGTPNAEKNAGAYNAGGQVEVQKRARALTDPAILKEYGDGYYPLRWVFDKGTAVTAAVVVVPL